jgi:hypothetical protein
MVIDPYDTNNIWYMTWPFGSIVLVLVLILYLAVLLLLSQHGIVDYLFTGLLWSLALERYVRNLNVAPVAHAITGRRGQWGRPFRSGVLKRGCCSNYSFGEVDCNRSHKSMYLHYNITWKCQLFTL